MNPKLFSVSLLFTTLGVLLITSVFLTDAKESKKNFVPKKQTASLEQRIASLTQRVVDLETLTSDLKRSLDFFMSEHKKISLLLSQERSSSSGTAQEDALTGAVGRVAPSVVSIVVSKDVPRLEVVYQNPFGDDPFFKDFDVKVPVYRQKGVTHKKVGAGTGFLVTHDGYIITNKHVVNDEKADYMVLLSNGTQKNAKVYYKDTHYDLAIIKIEGDGYTPVPLGHSDALKLGQTVIAIGNALGEYNNSVSVGIVSGLNRTIRASDGKKAVTLKGVLQTDAAINPGNSGGPLIDLGGKAVGVNVATVQGSQSIGFSIPIQAIRDTLENALGRDF